MVDSNMASETVTVFQVFWSIFITIWAGLDIMFIWFDAQFRLVFNAIPYTAISFLIGICCYAFLAFMMWAIDRVGQSRKRVFLKGFYLLYSILMIMFTIWRLGFIAMIDKELTVFTLGEFFFNLAYILFGLVLIIAFMKKIPWLKKALVAFLWIMFSLFTWVIGPLVGEIVLSSDTLTQFLLVGVIFGIPGIMYEYRRTKKKSL